MVEPSKIIFLKLNILPEKRIYSILDTTVSPNKVLLMRDPEKVSPHFVEGS